MKMPDIEREAREAVDRILHHAPHPGAPSPAAATTARGPQAPAAEPVTTATPEEPVSLASDLKTIASRLETLGEETVTKLETVAATPEGQLAFGALHAIIAAEDPALLATVTTIIGALVPKQPVPVEQAIAAAHAQDTATGDDPRTRSAS